MKIAMMLLPLACILAGFVLYTKKFKIDEAMYERIVREVEEREAIHE